MNNMDKTINDSGGVDRNKEEVNGNTQCDPAEEAVSTDSDEFLTDPLRYKNYNLTSSPDSNVIHLTQSMTISDTNSINERDDNVSLNASDILNPIQIPIVGYEIMEERARFTVYKLRIENKITGDCWYVFRRYTDFVRLCNRLRKRYKDVVKHLPRKKWLNNFDPIFIEERINGLQTLVNAILRVPELLSSIEIQDFFCLNEPPTYSETNEESRAMFEALEDTITELKLQLKEKNAHIDCLQEKIQTLLNENENLKKLIQ